MPRHYVPASADFATAVALGLGWGLLPVPQAERRSRRVGWCAWTRPTAVPLLDAIAAEIRAEACRVLG